MSQFQFSVGPWTVDDGSDAFGDPVREPASFAAKLKRFREIGFRAVQLHDEDVVPDIDNVGLRGMSERVQETRRIIDDVGLAVEYVMPCLWRGRATVDGAFTANDPACREYGLDRVLKAVDIARELDCGMVGLWFAREGSECPESKDPKASIYRVVAALNRVLEYDEDIRIFIKPKPNEPVDRSFVPTIGHALAISAETSDPRRIGGMVETAHAVMAGLDPVHEISFALCCNKLFSVHLNDQNGMKFDQNKAVGAENLRQAFNQVRVLVENAYGRHGRYVGLETRSMRTQPAALAFRHLSNSLRIVQHLEEKVRRFDYNKQKKFVDARDYEGLEMYVMELLMSG